MLDVGNKIKVLRLAEQLTQQQVANKLKIDRSNYSKYELGKREVNNEMLSKLAKLFDVTLILF